MNFGPTNKYNTSATEKQQVAAVLTVKGYIAAAIQRITLACAGYSLTTQLAGRCPKIAPSLGGIWAST